MARILATVLVVILAGCAGRGALSSPDAPSDAPVEGAVPGEAPPSEAAPEADAEGPPPRVGFRAPRVLAESRFTLADSHRFEQAAAGTRLRYRGSERPMVDVFLYPLASYDTEMSDSLRDHRVREGIDRAVREIEVFAERDLVVVDDSFELRQLEFETSGGPATALHRRVAFEYPESPTRDSHVILLGIERYFVKFRSTFPEAQREQGWDHLEAMAREFVTRLETGTEAELAALAEAADSLPDAFDFRIPRTLPASGYTGATLQRATDPARGARLGYRGTGRPQIQAFIIPIVYPPHPPETRIANALRTQRMDEEVERQLRELEALAERQGLRAAGPPRSTTMELETRYGTAAGRRLVLRLESDEGSVSEAHVTIFSIEQSIVIALTVIPETLSEPGARYLHAFVEEVAGTIRVTRPPPPDVP